MIIIFLLLLSSLLPHLSYSASVSVDIVNGREAQPHSRPYMVSIQENEEHVCGGFLISDKFVLTAAHCQESNEALTVVAGAHDLRNKKEDHVRIRVRSYDKHPDFKTDPNKPFKADLMILKRCRLGKSDSESPFSSKLREVKVKIMNNTDCENRWGRLYIASDMMCVYGPGGTCEGIQEVLWFCDGTAVGVTSFGDKKTATVMIDLKFI